MAYPTPYGAPQPSPYGYGPPVQKKRRGLKRTIFGGLGVLANLVGLFVMPFIAAMIGAIIAAMGMMDLQDLGGSSGTISGETATGYMISVPASEAASTTCEFEGSGQEIVAEPAESQTEVGELGGKTYVTVYQVTTMESGEISVDCAGASNVAYSGIGVIGVFVSIGIGLVIPVVLGLIALVMLIWGIVALIRSS